MRAVVAPVEPDCASRKKVLVTTVAMSGFRLLACERADAMGAGTTTNAPAVAPTTGRIDRDALQQR
jgi:hypothetical protein